MLQTFLLVATITVPIYGFFIYHMNWLDNKNLFVLTELILFGGVIALSFFPLYNMPKVTNWLNYYCLFLMIYLLILGYKRKFQRFNHVLAISLWIVFIAADLWEMPVFLYGYFELFDNNFSCWVGDWKNHIHRFYVLATIILFLQTTKLKFTKSRIALFIMGIACPFILLTPLGHVLWHPETLARITTLSFLGAAFYFE